MPQPRQGLQNKHNHRHDKRTSDKAVFESSGPRARATEATHAANRQTEHATVRRTIRAREELLALKLRERKQSQRDGRGMHIMLPVKRSRENAGGRTVGQIFPVRTSAHPDQALLCDLSPCRSKDASFRFLPSRFESHSKNLGVGSHTKVFDSGRGSRQSALTVSTRKPMFARMPPSFPGMPMSVRAL